MKITKAQVNDLVNEMNNLVFTKIKEELIKNTEKKIPHPLLSEEGAGLPTQAGGGNSIFKDHGIEILPEKLELSTPAKTTPEEGNVHPILAQKLSTSVQTETVKTEHTLDNLTKTTLSSSEETKTKIPPIDPYREIPE
jgi:hypothetical protein